MDSYTEPDYANCALLTIDVQNDFTLPGSKLQILGTAEAVPNIRRILEQFRLVGKPIVHIIRFYLVDGSNVDLCRRSMVEDGKKVVVPNTFGADLVQELRPNKEKLDAESLLSGNVQELAPNEYVIYKPRWGAFYDTPLQSLLKSKNVNTLVFTGCNFPNCPRTTIYEASERDYKIVAVEDAISGIYPKAVKELEGIGCELNSKDELLPRIK